jgi:hypothetical protein
VRDLLDDAGALVTRPTDPARISTLGPRRGRLAPDAAAWALTEQGGSDGWERLLERAGRTVQVRGTGRTAAALVAALCDAAVGTVLADTVDGVRADGTAPRDSGPPAATLPPADLVVLVEPAAADAEATRALLAEDRPHLSVVVREASIVVGPLVVPGRTSCLRCLDLHRSARDPGWPMVLAQVLGHRRRGTAGCDPEETTLSRLAAALACLQVVGFLDRLGSPSTTAADRPAPAAYSATLELALPDGVPERHVWPVHDECGCRWPPPRAAESARAVTMGW